MAIQLRPSPTSNNQDAVELLQALIETPPSPRDGGLAPIVLRSAVEQRRHALAGYLLRTWFDKLLQHAERLLLVTVLIVFGAWLADGPVRDWLHQRTANARPAQVVAAPMPTHGPPATPALARQLDPSIPLPYTTPDMAGAATQSEFMAPGQGMISQPLAVAPQPTRLLIPSIELDTPVEEVFVVNGVWEVADYAAGYLHGTALPDEGGNVVMAGHAGLRGGVFRDLGALVAGDDVYVDAGGWRYHYQVRESKNVWPTQVEVLESTGEAVLTLITCTNWDTQRLVVVADLLDTKPTPDS